MSIRRSSHDVRDEAEAIAIVDEFFSTQELSSDVRQKLLQSRDGLWRTVRIRAAFAGAGR